MRSILCMTIAACLIGAGAAAAQPFPAQTREPTRTSVATTGVDFSDRAAVARFHARLADAVREVCTSDVDDAEVAAQDRACAQASLDRAVASVNQPMLTALHGGADLIRLAARSDIH